MMFKLKSEVSRRRHLGTGDSICKGPEGGQWMAYLRK